MNYLYHYVLFIYFYAAVVNNVRQPAGAAGRRPRAARARARAVSARARAREARAHVSDLSPVILGLLFLPLTAIRQMDPPRGSYPQRLNLYSVLLMNTLRSVL